ncbi:hypothetical protein [Hyphococcus luteus]|uniref:Uncharacterized protein n=1 Tax=Hyphococcus luteus TaxID=2058213 RepID=A0A2S7JZN7_9PROT|nr:hypothetical protein [Marinicaulis flavus]PQA85668.1 hypothetical protein CW354_22320 [Marinicaulis flavus]
MEPDHTLEAWGRAKDAPLTAIISLQAGTGTKFHILNFIPRFQSGFIMPPAAGAPILKRGLAADAFVIFMALRARMLNDEKNSKLISFRHDPDRGAPFF